MCVGSIAFPMKQLVGRAWPLFRLPHQRCVAFVGGPVSPNRESFAGLRAALRELSPAALADLSPSSGLLCRRVLSPQKAPYPPPNVRASLALARSNGCSSLASARSLPLHDVALHESAGRHQRQAGHLNSEPIRHTERVSHKF